MYLEAWEPPRTPADGEPTAPPLNVFHSSDEEDAEARFEDAEEEEDDEDAGGRMKAFFTFLAVVVLYAAEINAS